MNIHEYQAKQLFERFDVPTPKGAAATTPEAAESVAAGLKTNHLVVKAQIHAGGRGKGTFRSGFQGGVHLCSTPAEVRSLAEKMLGDVLVTHQTGPEGRLVRQVLVAESVDIDHEYYLALLLDRSTASLVVVASTEGGVEIERVAEEHPDRIYREPVRPLLGFQPYEGLKIGRKLGFSGPQLRTVAKLINNLVRLFVSLDCSLVEINPLVITKNGEVMALDAKFNFDDNALYRQPEILAFRDIAEEDPREVAASKFGLNYIGLDGNIACLVNGAGLAMATMDIIKYAGGRPANFLDVGGGASEEQVTEAFKILIADKNVRAILVNIFGGIMRCDVIAQGIINAVKATSLPVPLVVRLEGTNVDLGKRLLEQSKLPIQSAPNLAEAARRVVAAAKATH
jgi:succinyl-CoA synthetase beta subunit